MVGVSARTTGRPAHRSVAPSTASPALQIIRGLYGDLTLQAGVADVTSVLRQNVKSNQLYLPAESKVAWLGDPAPGRAKSLLIIFRIGNNLYLKLIADMAGDTISAATAQRAMLLIGSSQQAPVAPRVQQPARPVQVSAPNQMLGGVPVMVTQPGAASQPMTQTQQEVQMGNVQQRRMEQFRQQ